MQVQEQVGKAWVGKDSYNHPRIFLQAHYRLKDHCKSIPSGRYLPDKKAYEFPATPATAASILSILRPYNLLYQNEVLELAERWKRLVAGAVTRTGQWPAEIVYTPWQHQIDAFHYLRWVFGEQGGAAGLFAGMGTGKSLVATALLISLKWQRTLIVCQSNKIEDWAREIQRYAPNSNIVTVELTGPIKNRLEVVKNHKRVVGGPQTVFIINYEGVWRKPLGDFLKSSSNFDAILLDEAQEIKSPASKISQYLCALGAGARYRLALTGTPAHDKLVDIYGIYKFLDAGVFGSSFEQFKLRYTIRKFMAKYSIIVGYQNQEELSEKMYHMAFRVSEDVLNLPEGFPPIIREVSLSKDARSAYNEFKKKLVLKRGTKEVTAANVLVKLLRLQQITSGFLPMIDENDKQVDAVPIDDTKYQELVSILNEISPDEPVVVFAKFTNDLARIKQACEETGRTYMEQSGQVKQWSEFQYKCTGGEVLGCQIDAGSTGIALFRSAYAIYYSLGFSLGNHLQSQKRLLRPGQTQRVRYIYIIAKDTVDNQIMSAMIHKKELVDYVVEDLYNGHWEDD